MKLQVLCTTMHQTDFSKIEEMNIETDVIFANQSDKNEYLEREFGGHLAKMITTDTKGLSVNRNIAIIYSDADIIVFADDDQVFVNGYEDIIINEFKEHPEAGAIKFLCKSTNPKRPMAFKGTKEFKRMHKFGLMSAGVHALAVKRNLLLKTGILFWHSLGAGSEVYCGEDSMFYTQMLKNGIKVYSSPKFVSYIKQEDSSWFKGYDEQFFESVGYLYKLLYSRLAPLVMIRRIARIRNCSYKKTEMFAMMKKGAKRAKNRS